MPNRKRTGLLFESELFQNSRPRRQKVAPPIVTLEEALSAGQQLGYISTPTPPNHHSHDQHVHDEEENWQDKIEFEEFDHEINVANTSVASPTPAFELASQKLAHLTRGVHFAKKKAKAIPAMVGTWEPRLLQNFSTANTRQTTGQHSSCFLGTPSLASAILQFLLEVLI